MSELSPVIVYPGSELYEEAVLRGSSPAQTFIDKGTYPSLSSKKSPEKTSPKSFSEPETYTPKKESISSKYESVNPEDEPSSYLKEYKISGGIPSEYLEKQIFDEPRFSTKISPKPQDKENIYEKRIREIRGSNFLVGMSKYKEYDNSDPRTALVRLNPDGSTMSAEEILIENESYERYKAAINLEKTVSILLLILIIIFIGLVITFLYFFFQKPEEESEEDSRTLYLWIFGIFSLLIMIFILILIFAHPLYSKMV